MRTSYHHADLRSALITRGRRLLLRDGYSHFSLRALAADIGVSHAAPYRHFRSREDLIATIVREDMAKFNEALAMGIQGESDPSERLFKLGDAYVFFFLDNPETLSLFSALPEQMAQQGEAMADLFSASSLNRQTKGEACDAGPKGDGFTLLENAARPFASRFALLSEREIILGYWAKVHGLATLLVSQRGFLSEEGLRARVRVLVRTPF
jgi:AcrR family transcriptional regulator